MRSIIKLVIKPEMNAAFENAFLKAGMLTRPKELDPDFEGELLRSLSDPTTYHVIATWGSPEAYTRWQQTSAEGADEAAMAVLSEALVEAEPGKIYELIARR